MAYGAGFENRLGSNPLVGSTPTLSASSWATSALSQWKPRAFLLPSSYCANRYT